MAQFSNGLAKHAAKTCRGIPADCRPGPGFQQFPPLSGQGQYPRRSPHPRTAGREGPTGRRPRRGAQSQRRGHPARPRLPAPLRPVHQRHAPGFRTRGRDQRLARGAQPQRFHPSCGRGSRPSRGSHLRPRGSPPDLPRRRQQHARQRRSPAGQRHRRRQHRVHHRPGFRVRAAGKPADGLRQLHPTLLPRRQDHPGPLRPGVHCCTPGTDGHREQPAAPRLATGGRRLRHHPRSGAGDQGRRPRQRRDQPGRTGLAEAQGAQARRRGEARSGRDQAGPPDHLPGRTGHSRSDLRRAGTGTDGSLRGRPARRRSLRPGRPSPARGRARTHHQFADAALPRRSGAGFAGGGQGPQGACRSRRRLGAERRTAPRPAELGRTGPRDRPGHRPLPLPQARRLPDRALRPGWLLAPGPADAVATGTRPPPQHSGG